MKERLRQYIGQALQTCFDQQQLHSGQIPEIGLEVPAHAEHGDFSTNVAMILAKAEKKAPRKVAEAIVAALGEGAGMWNRVDIAGPGFINFYLSPRCWFGVLDEVVRQGEQYGRTHSGAGRKVQVEFVSANPTGPLHIGHGRGAATGDAVAAVLSAAGYEVQREYYINDAGNQMLTLGRSLMLRYLELLGETVDFPTDCYQGVYVIDLAREILEREGDRLQHLPEEEALRFFAEQGGGKIREGIEEDLAAFGVRFDNWYSEQSLYDRQSVDRGIALLKERGLTYEKEGAIWFRTTDFGDDKDRVLVRSNGVMTYFASDVAYHKEKFERGFDMVIDVWGADHHGYVPRMKAVLAGLGRNPEDLQIILVQLVNLLRDGQQVAMSTRSGEFVTLREVIDEVGRDACRFFFLMRRSDSQLDFDLELAKKQSNENPVFYVQYAHARVCSINRNAVEQGLAVPEMGKVDFEVLALEDELALARLLSRYPEVVDGAAAQFEPHRVVFYLQELAARFHSYYNKGRVLVEDPEVSRARLYLVNCVRIVLRNALLLLGVSAPERM
ncbi:MAG: arginine--tRNA ligase [Syntrophotalea acetylenica]|jgi:arginyl-tRNA synthetase|uniref:arginine--tRNA ligase n=1 Tax=Syntrophotalea acetylenica TaxID=29542 RepID=UPI002A35B33D|nr:arginine--tRNA ligase [Syntrophotalea acetylenica]MDD4456390.1 arginine--tRNA ligase [Syntrophotalea acetylenica]MDY0261885.1 arginine--tRNA ligase [Syntrophotalea acetylenica]